MGEALSKPLHSARDKHGRTALHRECSGHSCSMSDVLRMLDDGADANCRDLHGQTSLHMASFIGYAHVITVLLQRGADVSLRDGLGRTALHYGCLSGQPRAVPVLLAAGCNASVSDHEGVTAAHMAAALGQLGALGAIVASRWFTKHVRDNSGRTPLHYACRENRVGASILLLSMGADIESESLSGTPLCVAVRSALQSEISQEASALNVIMVLLRYGADINRPSGTDGLAPLHLAVSSRSCGNEAVHLVDLLLSRGASVGVRDNSGSTSLHHACRNGRVLAVRMMLDSGASPCAVDSEGSSPLHEACAEGSVPISILLMRAGASLYLKNSAGRSPFALTRCIYMRAELYWMDRQLNRSWRARRAFLIVLLSCQYIGRGGSIPKEAAAGTELTRWEKVRGDVFRNLCRSIMSCL